MICVKHLGVIVVALAGGALCRADTFAYIERWASGTLTTAEPFESWRIHVVVPDGDYWKASELEGWLSGGPTWYYNWDAGFIPDPNLFPTYPDTEFTTYCTAPDLYPNSDLIDGEFLWDGYGDETWNCFFWVGGSPDTDGDRVVFQATVLNPIPDHYGTIEFNYVTDLEPFGHPYTFLIPEPASGVLLALVALGAWSVKRK